MKIQPTTAAPVVYKQMQQKIHAKSYEKLNKELMKIDVKNIALMHKILKLQLVETNNSETNI